ncbi:MAG: tRNA (adenosine(37)-N6)-dimethylallyltransferase MiaA [Clostridia bacterium]|nr:tRNA (adenosine(37)-N6)-dimethylallyltransferase MiaA [Clostridia bacterium]
MKIPIVAVVGSTASGKTALGIEIAKRFNGEVVSCDSMQIYKNLDIGTAKPSKEEMQGIAHHMLDIAEPDENFSVGRFCTAAHKVIEEIHARGKLPVLVGGTGLYIDNIVFETKFCAPPRDEKLSEELLCYAKEHSNEALFALLQKEDPEAAKKLHPNDLKRVIRAIETVRTSKKTRAQLDLESRSGPSKYNCLYLAIDMERETLYSRINRRVDIMLEQGLEKETLKYIYPMRKKGVTALQAIGYKEMLWYLEGKCTYGEMKNLLARNTRRYAKRQLTWFRANKSIHWLPQAEAIDEASLLITEMKGAFI